MIPLAPNVRAYCPDADAVNAALRGLIALIPAKRRYWIPPPYPGGERRQGVRQARSRPPD